MDESVKKTWHSIWSIAQILILLYALWVAVYVIGRQLIEGNDTVGELD